MDTENTKRDTRRARRAPADPSDRINSAYRELRRVATFYRRKYSDQTMQTTEVVHEAFIRLATSGPEEYVNQAHFFESVGRAMHATLVDRARRRRALKRGGDYVKVSIDDVDPADAPAPDFEELYAALENLNAYDSKLRQLLELRFFIGLSVEEVAAAVGRGESTVRRDCAMARAWLQRELRAGRQRPKT